MRDRCCGRGFWTKNVYVIKTTRTLEGLAGVKVEDFGLVVCWFWKLRKGMVMM